MGIYNLGEFPWRDLDLSKGRSEVTTSVFFNTVSNRRPGLCSRQLSLMMAKVYGGQAGQTRPWTVPFGEEREKKKRKKNKLQQVKMHGCQLERTAMRTGVEVMKEGKLWT